MSDNERDTLKELFTKKFNVLTGAVITVLAIFIALFVTYMVKSSNRDGIQDTQLNILADSQIKLEQQVSEIAKAVNILITENEVEKAEYKNLLKIITETNDKAQKIEWAVLTGDKSLITRDKASK
jgi:hypothetical protein